MRRVRFFALVTACTLPLLSTSLALGATDYLLAGKKLVIKDSTTKKLVFISKDPTITAPPHPRQGAPMIRH